MRFHEDWPDEVLIPDSISDFYYCFNKSDYIPLFHTITDDKLGVDVPVFTFAKDYLDRLIRKDILPDFSIYQAGFINGFNSSFIPFIDTPENRRELIMKEALKPISGFPVSTNRSKGKGTERYYKNELVQEYGVKVGRIYKAWQLIFENPKFFEEEFKKALPVNNASSELSHRIILIAHEYKVKARLTKVFTRKEMLAVSAKRYQASFTLIPNHLEYRAPTIDEMEIVVKLLSQNKEDAPALRMAVNDLDQMLN